MYDEKSPILVESGKHVEEGVHPQSSIETEPLKQEEVKSSPGSARRVEVDIIIIFLTYGIFLFHLFFIYNPESNYYDLFYPNMGNVTIAEDPFTILSLNAIILWFKQFMHAWNMPMFFYLSGQNTYSALNRRTETQFRDERVHRLLVPALFLSLVTKFPLTIS